MISYMYECTVVIGIVLLPFPTIPHFIWPVSWCLLADICNHTWIPECGHDELMDFFRIFIDECDMFEFNCDHETDYEITNYSECFGNMICPKPRPCPSRPTCPDHRFHKQGDKYIFINEERRRNNPHAGRRMNNLQGSTLPVRMLQGKRRYTPEVKKRRERMRRRTRRTTASRTRPKGPPKPFHKELPPSSIQTQSTLIIRRVTVIKNGTVFVKVIKKLFRNKTPREADAYESKEDDFME